MIIKRNPFPHHSAAFTLLEILVAVFLFAVLISTVFASFRSIHDHTEKLQEDDRFYEAGQAALARMVLDLEGIYVLQPPLYQPPGFDAPADIYRVQGEVGFLGDNSFSKLRFTSVEHLPMNGQSTGGIAQIVYYVQQSEPAHFVLRRADQPWPYGDFEESAKDPVLCENMQSLTFKFRDAAGELHEEWDSDSQVFDYQTPRAVEIIIKLGNDSRSVTLSTMADLRTYRAKVTGAK